jgi:hypothetical protein
VSFTVLIVSALHASFCSFIYPIAGGRVPEFASHDD